MANKQTYQFGASHLTLEFGDLTQSNAQVLVSSDDYYLSMAGGISRRLLKAGGNAIALDAASKVPAALGDVVVTTAGSLPAQYVFHAITLGPDMADFNPRAIIRQTTLRCLQLLDSFHLKSIAFPTIGAGAAGYSYQDVAVEMADVISEDLKNRLSPIEVTIYLFDRFGTLQESDYLNFFEEFAKQSPEIAKRTVVEPSDSMVVSGLSVVVAPKTDHQMIMERRNRLRWLISSLEDKRFELEARQVDLIATNQTDEIAKIEQQLKENHELRLKFYGELKSLSPEPSPPILAEKQTATARDLTRKETYIDFDLQIADNGHVIASSPVGEATADISTLPPEEIQLALQLIEKRQTTEGLLKKVGHSLYSWLFPAAIHTHLHVTEEHARNEKSKLRLRLRVESASIASLPLEFLYRERGGYYLATNPDTVLSRYLNLPLPGERLRRREGPVHMLLILSEPLDQPPFNSVSWGEMVHNALAGPVTEGQMTIRTVMLATRREIRDALLSQKPDIIQFVGHGIYRDGKGYIALVDEKTHATWHVDEQSFANLFQGFDEHLGLINLTACESAESSDPQGFIGLAPKLVQRGTPAVVAMQYTVKIAAAKVFVEDFYASVAARKPVDWAVQWARNVVALEFKLDNREFATPVLYMRAKDGNVF